MQFLEGKRGDQVMTGVLLVGVGILFLLNMSLVPGMFLVVALALMARSLAEGKGWFDNKWALGSLALWLLFTLGGLFSWGNFNWWPLLLIGLGLYMLFGDRWRANPHSSRNLYQRPEAPSAEKAKNEDLL